MAEKKIITSAVIQLNIRGDIAHCILSSPPKNEMNADFFRCLRQVISGTASKLKVKGMIVYGAGRHFSSGANVEELIGLYQSPGGPPWNFNEENREIFLAMESLQYPVVAAVNGCCLGAGFELALACRYRIASPCAVFSLPECGFGIMPGCGGTVRLTELVGAAKAVELILSGRMVSAEEALKTGILDAVADKAGILAEAEKMIASV
jgi:enoyl-CoA hydratase/carnithine racemase